MIPNSGLRLACLVPWCRRTIARSNLKAPPGFIAEEWICGNHWRGVPLHWRKLYQRMKWRCGQALPATEIAKYRDRANRAWQKLRRMAVERAAGIG